MPYSISWEVRTALLTPNSYGFRAFGLSGFAFADALNLGCMQRIQLVFVAPHMTLQGRQIRHRLGILRDFLGSIAQGRSRIRLTL